MNWRKLTITVSFVFLLSGSILLGEQAWIFGKAQVAKVMIAQSFKTYLKEGTPQPPWSWADMHPIARMEVPRLALKGGACQALRRADIGEVGIHQHACKAPLGGQPWENLALERGRLACFDAF